MDAELVCKICGEQRSDSSHNSSVNHRFHFNKWVYTNFRKNLRSDRHGVRIELEVRRINNFQYNFSYVHGTYTIRVTPEQLNLHNNTLTLIGKIRNTRKDPIYITSANFLHFAKYFEISLDGNIVEQDDYILLGAGRYLPFSLTYTSDLLQCSTSMTPLGCDFQTIDNKFSFTIIRDISIIIDRGTDLEEDFGRSPFSCQKWSDVHTLRPSWNEPNYKDQYPIPKKYIPVFDHGLESFDDMDAIDEINQLSLRETVQVLDQKNYSRFWHILLWMEERATILMLAKYNMEKVTVELKDDETLVLEVPGLAEKRPSVIVGDYIKIRMNEDHTSYKGFVRKVNEKTIEISHVDDELLVHLERNPNSLLDVAFMLNRLSLERMHAAVDRVAQTGIVRKLFPSEIVPVRNDAAKEITTFFDDSIRDNTEQRNAVNKIVNSVQDLPYIVFGPPGTGKTVTIVEAILQIKKSTKKKILVCAPSNSACDMLAMKLMRNCNEDELIRIHSKTREMSTINEELKEYSNIEDDVITGVFSEHLEKYRIVVTTLVLIGRFTGRDYHPDCVFIDEAAQASEPETDIAIALAGQGKQIVLAGDPEQLGPMATGIAAKYGLGQSLLERLMSYPVYSRHPQDGNYNSDFITMLKLNFRSHPDILQIPNDEFYHNLLEPQSHTAQQDPIVSIAIFPFTTPTPSRQKGRAVEFCSVMSKEQKEGSSPSYFNSFEVHKVEDYVQALMRLNLVEACKVRQDQIGIVTPYKRQMYKIKEALKRRGYEGVEVGTTEAFQGREKRIIIISTVRAQEELLLHDSKFSLGFVKEDKRFNVAVTRAISKLIVIGCPLVLRTDKKWNAYMDMCQNHGTYFGNWSAPDSLEFKQDVISRMSTFSREDGQRKKQTR